jgi:hypothetical protein
MIDINIFECVGNPNQIGKSFVQRGIDCFPKGMAFVPKGTGKKSAVVGLGVGFQK